MTAKKTPLAELPVFVMDIDGVFNPDDVTTPGYRMIVNKSFGLYRGRFAYNHPEHVKLIKHVQEFNEADFAWATSWVHQPEMLDWYEKKMGFKPGQVARIEVPRESGDRFGYTYKFTAIKKHIKKRPAIWVDDVWGGKEWGWAEDRTAEGIPTAIVQTNSSTGLDGIGVKAILEWLHRTEVKNAKAEKSQGTSG